VQDATRSDSIHTSTLTLSKDGWISVDDTTNAIRPLLERQLVRMASHRLRLLSDRGLVDRHFQPGPPLSIEFDATVFGDARGLKAFSALILRYPRAAKAMLHSNPYLHMSLTDEADGSSFDLWVLSARRALLAPRLQATEIALDRLINYIGETFRDAQIKEFEANENS
jgi:hypothetical protein